MLVLGAFEGAMTPQLAFHFNQGICGAAASAARRYCRDVSKIHAILPVRLRRVRIGRAHLCFMAK